MMSKKAFFKSFVISEFFENGHVKGDSVSPKSGRREKKGSKSGLKREAFFKVDPQGLKNNQILCYLLEYPIQH